MTGIAALILLASALPGAAVLAAGGQYVCQTDG